MSKLFVLLKAQKLNSSAINVIRHSTDTKKRARSIGMLVAYAILGLMMVGYSFAAGMGYGAIGLVDLLPSLAMFATVLFNLLFTFIKANGYLFAYKDYEQIMSLPIPVRTVISAKFLYMYLQNLIFSLGIMLPIGVAYFIYTGFAPIRVLVWIVCAFATPFIPMTIASIFGAIIAAIGSRFKYKVLVQTIITMAFLVGIFILSYSLQTVQDSEEIMNDLFLLAKTMEKTIDSVYPMAVWFSIGLNEAKYGYVGLFVVLSAVIYLIFRSVLSVKYCAINTALLSSAKAGNYQVKKMQKGSLMQALVRKEWKRFSGSTSYMVNTGVGIILAVIASVGLFVAGTDAFYNRMPIPGFERVMCYVMPVAIVTLIGMCNTPSVSLSLEGKTIWILKSLPVEIMDVLKAKILFNLLLQIPTAIISNIFIILACKTPVFTALLAMVVSIMMCVMCSILGMILGICFVNYEWENEIQVIKQGAASAFGIFLCMFIGMGLAVAVFAGSMFMDGNIILLILLVVLSIVSALLWKILSVIKKI